MFCSALGRRRLTFSGDSTMQQLAASLMNFLSVAGAPCLVNVSFAHSDTLIGLNLGMDNRGFPFLDAARRVGWPELQVINAGLHISKSADFTRVLQTVKSSYEAALASADGRRLPRLIWATSVGTPYGPSVLPASPRDIPGYWERLRGNASGAQIRLYNHDLLEGWDDQPVSFWRGMPWASVLDLRPLWQRPDAKVDPHGLDVAHVCLPGPFREVAVWLTALLQAPGTSP